MKRGLAGKVVPGLPYGPNAGYRDHPWVAVCVCGWAGKFPGLKAATAAWKLHEETGVEGCDHAVSMEEVR